MVWAKWAPTGKMVKPCFLPCTKINSKWIRNHNVRLEILKELEENRSKILQDIGRGKGASIAQARIPGTDK